MKYVLKQRGDAELNNEELQAKSVFRVGMELYGYCCGVFGRDSYGVKKVTKIQGNYIHVEEKEWDTSLSADVMCERVGNVYSWVDLLESSNTALESGEFEGQD